MKMTRMEMRMEMTKMNDYDKEISQGRMSIEAAKNLKEINGEDEEEDEDDEGSRGGSFGAEMHCPAYKQVDGGIEEERGGQEGSDESEKGGGEQEEERGTGEQESRMKQHWKSLCWSRMIAVWSQVLLWDVPEILIINFKRFKQSERGKLSKAMLLEKCPVSSCRLLNCFVTYFAVS
eukprot:598644-Hanusia_phi.AAC.1